MPFLASWRLWGLLAAFLAALGAFAYVRHLQADVGRQRAALAVATQQAANNAEAVRQVDRYEHTQTIIRERASDAVQAVQAAPDASAPLPDGLRAAWASGVASVRGNGSSGLPDGPADVPR